MIITFAMAGVTKRAGKTDMNRDENTRPPWKRKRLWLLFIACYLSAPAAVIMAIRSDIGETFAWILAGAGTLAAGFILAKLFTRRAWVFATLGIVFTLLIAALNAAFAWGLVLYILSGWHGC